MSGGSNPIKGNTTIHNASQPSQADEIRGPSSKKAALEFQRVLSDQRVQQADPKTYLQNLGKITQASELPFSQRLAALRLLTEKAIARGPYSNIEDDARKEMIDSIAEVLADSPRALPRAVTRLG